MKRPVALALVVAIFLLGALVGVLGTHVFYVRQMSKPGGLANLVLGVAGDPMAHRLDLRPDQRRQLEAILDEEQLEILRRYRREEGDLFDRFLE